MLFSNYNRNWYKWLYGIIIALFLYWQLLKVTPGLTPPPLLGSIIIFSFFPIIILAFALQFSTSRHLQAGGGKKFKLAFEAWAQQRGLAPVVDGFERSRLGKRFLGITLGQYTQLRLFSGIIDNNQVTALNTEIVINVGGENSAASPTCAIQVFLPRPLPGKVVVRHKTGAFQPILVKDRALESAQFNKDTQIISDPPNLVTNVFSPDLMDWYLNQTIHPVIHMKNNYLTVALDGGESVQHLDQLLTYVRTLSEHLKKSGVLLNQEIHI